MARSTKKAKQVKARAKVIEAEIKGLKKELAKLRRLRTLGYITPFGRIAEIENFIATKGKSHGW